jgi:predicted DNA-binding ribbon-helix-helix protein
VIIGRHKTSITLEHAFWDALKQICQEKGSTLSSILMRIDNTRTESNLSSNVRVYVLNYFYDKHVIRPEKAEHSLMAAQ